VADSLPVMPGFNKYELELFSKKAADAFVRDGTDLDDSITTMARENGFSDHHIERVAQKANSFVNASLVSGARESKSDPRVSFKLASASCVKDRVRGKDKAKAMAKKADDAKTAALFVIPKAGFDKSAAVSAAFGAAVNDPFSKTALSMDPVEVARSYIERPGETKVASKRIDAQTLSLSCETLETMQSLAREKLAMAKVAAADLEQALVDEVGNLILSGNSPATLRDVVRVGVHGQKLAGYIDGIISHVGAELGAREGKSEFSAGSRVNANHPLLEKVAKLTPAIANAGAASREYEKMSSARKEAESDLREAMRGGR
jgi:hypothetical protein